MLFTRINMGGIQESGEYKEDSRDVMIEALGSEKNNLFVWIASFHPLWTSW
jgi:hypothetical protein